MDAKKTIKETQNNLSENFQVVKNNILNEAVIDGKTTLVEYRLILIALSKISPLSESITVHFEANDFCNLLGLVTDGMYGHIKKSSKQLASRTLTLEDKVTKKGITIPWLRNIKYDEAFISITFNPDLEKHILNIRKKGGYTKYFIKNILKLDSVYAIRLYEILKQYQTIGQRKISLVKLKEWMGANKKSYTKMFAFRNRVLKPSKERINMCTDIIFDYEEIKDNRQTKDIIFYIQLRNTSSDYRIAKKSKIILAIQNKIFELTGHTFHAKHMNDIHRIILLELYRQLENKQFCKIHIQHPEEFFIHILAKIKKEEEPYIDLSKEEFKDY
ncbi:MAG: replication initiation protein [Fusobacteriaceae bacterium]|nr:replication initiation protein [Fusobacteriaceae bacterium]